LRSKQASLKYCNDVETLGSLKSSINADINRAINILVALSMKMISYWREIYGISLDCMGNH